MNEKGVKATPLRQATSGDVVVLESAKMTAAAFRILAVPDVAARFYRSDLDERYGGFHVFGGELIEKEKDGWFSKLLRKPNFGGEILLLGSVDNLSAAANVIPQDGEAHYPNSFPSDFGSASYLLTELYEAEKGHPEQDNKPSNEAALASFRNALGRTVTGEGYCYRPKPHQRSRVDYTCNVVAIVTLRTEESILLRPIVIS